MLTKTCPISGTQFTITDEDLQFYEKMGVPTPTLCPKERQRRRLAWQNMYQLYHRKCDATGKKIISNFSADKSIPIYDQTYWWSNKWDATDFGQEFDFSRPFFEQFSELLQKAPQPNLDTDYLMDKNANFCNFAGQQRNCYLIFHSSLNEDCYYGTGIKESKNIVDSWNVFYSELLYECIDCRHSYNCAYCQDCQQCSDSWFLKNCVSCKNCFGCTNLRQKQYYLFNKPVGKAAFEKYITEFNQSNAIVRAKLKQQFADFQVTQPHRAMQGVKYEDCSGDHISECKNCLECFDIQESEDMKFCERIYNGPNSDCYDTDQFGIKIQQIYEGSEIGHNAQRILFSAFTRNQVYEIFYSVTMNASQHCFGCVSLHQKKYCILNKQYTPEAYEKLKTKIINHMKKTGEWGEFFPIEISPFGYNETIAQEYFPLAKNKAFEKGYRWHNEEPSAKYNGPTYKVPEIINDVEDEILDKILTCSATGKNYRIVKPELDFYRNMHLPIPTICPDERHQQRMKLRNPRQLYNRQCSECQTKIQTTYAPDRSEKVLCEKCYLKVID
jgi:hypothetical protein